MSPAFRLTPWIDWLAALSGGEVLVECRSCGRVRDPAYDRCPTCGGTAVRVLDFESV